MLSTELKKVSKCQYQYANLSNSWNTRGLQWVKPLRLSFIFPVKGQPLNTIIMFCNFQVTLHSRMTFKNPYFDASTAITTTPFTSAFTSWLAGAFDCSISALSSAFLKFLRDPRWLQLGDHDMITTSSILFVDFKGSIFGHTFYTQSVNVIGLIVWEVVASPGPKR